MAKQDYICINFQIESDFTLINGDNLIRNSNIAQSQSIIRSTFPDAQLALESSFCLPFAKEVSQGSNLLSLLSKFCLQFQFFTVVIISIASFFTLLRAFSCSLLQKSTEQPTFNAAGIRSIYSLQFLLTVSTELDYRSILLLAKLVDCLIG